MSHTTDNNSSSLLRQISRDRSAGSPFTRHLELAAQAQTDERPKQSTKSAARGSTQAKKPEAPKKVNEPPEAEDCSDEPFISARFSKDGQPKYCTQIRRRTENGPINVSKTFSKLQDARKWRDDMLARIQLGLLNPSQEDKSKSKPRVCDLIQKRKDKGRSVGRPAAFVCRPRTGHQ
ncbi:MAG: hypothetical protein KDK02_10270 [Rhodobacteraceae bacterium]|nr:hypothetical protein [Paracoccaceae bacterium]